MGAGVVVGDVVVIDDGQYRWGAGRAQLLAALGGLGWERLSPQLWRERPRSADEESIAAYTERCGEVDELAGMEAGSGFAEPSGSACFRFSPDQGAGVWVWYEG